MKDLNHMTVSRREWGQNSALYARYEVVREEKTCVVLERKPEYQVGCKASTQAATATKEASAMSH